MKQTIQRIIRISLFTENRHRFLSTIFGFQMKKLILVVIYFISWNFSPILSILTSCSNINDCRDPFGSICVNGRCQCKDKFPITESSGICLDYALEMDTPCWLAEQCRMIDATTCMRPSGKTSCMGVKIKRNQRVIPLARMVLVHNFFYSYIDKHFDFLRITLNT